MFSFGFKADFEAIRFMFNSIQEELADILLNTAEEIRTEWLDEIDKADVPEGHKISYAKTIQIDADINSDYTARVMVRGGGNLFSNLVEFGADRFDMKIGLLKSNKAKMSKEGYKYLIIPFKHFTPGALQKNVLPKSLYEKVKKLKFGKSMKKGKFNLNTGEEKDIQTYKKKEEHRKGLYEGITKVGRKGHAGYMTFRVVSEKSDASSWWHPGFRASPVYKKVVDKLTSEDFKNNIVNELKQRIGL